MLHSVEPTWNIDFGALNIRWQAYDDDSSYDLIVVRTGSEGGIKSIITLAGIDGTSVTATHLYLDTSYNVSVMVHGCPETESEINTAKTLPTIVSK